MAQNSYGVQTHRVQDTRQRLEGEAEAAGATADNDADAANATTETNPTTGEEGLRIANGEEGQTFGQVSKAR